MKASKPATEAQSSARSKIPEGYVLQDEATIYMDPNGVISKTSMEADTDYTESVHSIPSPKELRKCSKEACKKKCKKPPKRPENQQRSNDVAKTTVKMPEKTDVKKFAANLSFLMESLSKARMAKRPQISMTTNLRRSTLSQDSDVTAVDAQTEAAAVSSRTPRNVVTNTFSGYIKPTGLLGGAPTKTVVSKTPSKMKLHRSKTMGTKSIENLSAKNRPIQITCRLQPDSSTAANMKVDQRTKQMISQYLRNLGKTPK